MKSIFKIILLTLISCCYLNTVFEFSNTEKKANFENETHTYIHAENESQAYTVKTARHHDDLVHFIDYFHHYLIASEKSNPSVFPFYKNTPPSKSNKLYLYHSVFLI